MSLTEREKFILDVCRLLGWSTEFDASIRDAGILYDAGYRKFEIVDEEQ
jgi:hypothetical protein